MFASRHRGHLRMTFLPSPTMASPAMRSRCRSRSFWYKLRDIRNPAWSQHRLRYANCGVPTRVRHEDPAAGYFVISSALIQTGAHVHPKLTGHPRNARFKPLWLQLSQWRCRRSHQCHPNRHTALNVQHWRTGPPRARLLPRSTESLMSQPTSTKVLRPSTVLVSLLKRSWQPSPTSVFSISQLLMIAGGLNDPARPDETRLGDHSSAQAAMHMAKESLLCRRLQESSRHSGLSFSPMTALETCATTAGRSCTLPCSQRPPAGNLTQ